MNKLFFQAARETDLAEKRRLSRQSQVLSWLRLFIFFLLLLTLAAAWDTNALWLLLLAAALALTFAALLRRHNRLGEQRILLESHIATLSNFLARFSCEWQSFPVTGSEHLRDDLPQAQDLSLFGPASIYQYICAARTKAGRDRLAAALSPFPRNRTLAKKRQAAVKELITRPLLVLELEAAAALLPNGHDTKPLLTVLGAKNTAMPMCCRPAEPAPGTASETENDAAAVSDSPKPTDDKDNIETASAPAFLNQRQRAGTAFISWVLPISLLLALVGAAMQLIVWEIPTAIILIQLMLSFLLGKRTAATQKPLADMHRELHLYEMLFSRLEESTFQSSELKSLQETLHDGEATRSLRRLASLADYANTRHNIIFLLLSNALYLGDLHFARRVLNWQEKASRHLGKWLAVWAEIEVLLSLASIGLVREKYVFPELLEEGGPRLEASGLTHLLIPEENAVPNGIESAAGTRIITGSNMSGKTTYLRTIASACVLAFAGAPVPGEAMRLSPLYIFTSIRVTDDAAHGLSTFYAEILRIKSMMTFKEKSLPMLIVIDEIFKGTNSADRLIGAREAISRLTGADFITLVSTHDFELCEIESDAAPVTNWHFEESYEDDKLLFDYKIKEGRCTTRNAQYLLKMAGIME